MNIELFNDSFQNWKRHLSCKAQLIISDPPYNLAENMYASNPMWYEGGDNKNGESKFAKKAAFDTDFDFRPAEWMHFCSKLLVKEPKEKGKAPCMVIFCGFEQQMQYIELGKRYGFNHYINLVFRKNYSPQVLKTNMKIVGNCEYGLVLYRDKLPKFNNNGRMVFNCIDWPRDTATPKVHPTQKPVKLLEMLIELSQILARLSLTRRQEVALRLLRQLIVDARHTDSRLRKNFAGRLMRRCARAYSRNYSDKISIINHAYFDNGLQVNEYQTI